MWFTLIESLPLDKKNPSFDFVLGIVTASTSGGVKFNLLFLKKFYRFGINFSPPPKMANMIYVLILIWNSPITGSGKVHMPTTSFLSRRTVMQQAK